MRGPALLAAATLAIAAGVSPAGAVPPVPYVVDWTGFYVGGNIGLGVGNKKLYDIFPAPDYQLDGDASQLGWVGGLQFGYNYQIRSLVVGLEGTFDWSGVDTKTFGCFTFGNQHCSLNSEWFGTIVGRMGGAIGSALFFIDGGAAWTRDTLTDVATVQATSGGVTSLPGDVFQGSAIRFGWTVGGGIEYAVSHNWTVRAEYSYMDFGQHTIDLIDGAGNFFPESVKQTVQLVKFGFDYRFNGSGLAGGEPIMSYAAPDHPILTKAAEEEPPGATVRGFSVFDVGKQSVDGLVGGIFALTRDIDTSGPRLWVEGGSGWYKFGTTSGPISGIYEVGSILGGYAFEGNNYEINLLAGVSAENDMLSTIDIGDPVQGTQGGVKVRGDAWINPTPQTLVYGEGEYSTAFKTYWTLGKVGYDITGGKQIFVGPEVMAFGDERYEQWRVGGHITQIKIGKVELDLSAGYAHDSVVGTGAYTHAEASIDF